MRLKYRRYFLYYLARPLIFLLSILPMRVGVAIGGLIGRMAFWLLPKYRKATLENLTAAFKDEKNCREITAIGEKVFENLGKVAAEVINFPKITKNNIENIVEMENKERLDRVLEAGRGAILLTGHIGNWELLGPTLRIKGYPGAAIGRRIYFSRYNKLLNSLRRYHDVNIIYRDDSPKKALKILKNNGVIAILADQDVDSVNGVFVDFFGRPAYTPTGPVQLAKASGAKLIPAFIVRQKDRHMIMVEEPIHLEESNDGEKDLIANTQKWTKLIESYIRKYPEQWVWMHRRWKTKSS